MAVCHRPKVARPNHLSFLRAQLRPQGYANVGPLGKRVGRVGAGHDGVKTLARRPGASAQAQSTFCLFWYHVSICGSAIFSMRARLIFMVGVRQPFSMLQGSWATTIICSRS